MASSIILVKLVFTMQSVRNALGIFWPGADLICFGW